MAVTSVRRLSLPGLCEASQVVIQNKEEVGNYELGATLGVGAYAVVRLATHKLTREKAAVKVIPKDTSAGSTGTSTTSGFAATSSTIGGGGKTVGGLAKSIVKEMTIQKALNHSNISKFLESKEQDDCVYFFVEYAAGGELFDKIQPDVGIDEDLAHLYFIQLAAGVQFMHHRGIAHRDLKPENILLDHTGTLKISDFGLATVFRHNGRVRPLEQPCGSAPYVAPEVLNEDYMGDSADIWSMGVILFVMLIGNTPWEIPSEESAEYVNFLNDPSWEHDPWSRFQGSLKLLLRGILTINPSRRFKMKSITTHAWYLRPNDLLDPLDNRSVKDPRIVAAKLMAKLEALETVSLTPVVSYSQPMAMMGRQPNRSDDEEEEDTFDMYGSSKLAQQRTRPIFAGSNKVKRFASQPTMNYDDYGGGIGKSFHEEVLDLSCRPVERHHHNESGDEDDSNETQPPLPLLPEISSEQGFLSIFSSARLTRFFTITPPLVMLRALDHVMTSNLMAHDLDEARQMIKISTTDKRKCFLNGEVTWTDYDHRGQYLFMFVKSRGDPLEWKRLFRALVKSLGQLESTQPLELEMMPRDMSDEEGGHDEGEEIQYLDEDDEHDRYSSSRGQD